MKYICIFLSFIIVCTFCGSLFGFTAGGTFVGTMESFSDTMNSAKKVVVTPFNKIMKFLGLGGKARGGSAVVYRLESDEFDLTFKNIPSNAFYCAQMVSYDVSGKHYILPGDADYFIFFDIDGLPIDCYVYSHGVGPLTDGDLIGYGNKFRSLEFDTSYFNASAKMLYFDITVYTLHKSNREEWHEAVNASFKCFLNDSMTDYSYQGNFKDLDTILSNYSPPEVSQ